jgi:hypothetical protein
MKQLTKSQIWLIGISVGAFIAILSVQTTRWYAFLQLGAELLPHALQGSNVSFEKDAAQLISQSPRDYRLQLADVSSKIVQVETSTPNDNDDKNISKNLKVMDSLIARFPTNPSAYAFVMRFEASAIPSAEWKAKENIEYGGAPMKNPADSAMPAGESEVLLQDFIRQGKMGEVVDPNNAFFPLLLAQGYFANHDDAAAEAALVSGDHDSEWNEYLADEIDGRIQVAKKANGGIIGLSRVAIMASQLFPQYAKMRSTARMATWEAMESEQSGNFSQGIAIRHALMHYGSLMRAKGSTMICNLVGIAIAQIAVSRPGGAPRLTQDKSLPEDQRSADLSRRRLALYSAFLIQQNDAPEESWVNQEISAGAAARSAMSMAEHQVWDLKVIAVDGTLIIVSSLLSTWLLLAGIFWGIAVIIRHLTALPKDRPLSRRVIVQAAVGFILILLLGVFVLNASQAAHTLQQLAGYFGANTDENGLQDTVLALIALTPFFIFAIVVWVRASFRKRPVIESVLSSSIAGAIPTVSILLLLYCGSLAFLARQDGIISHQIATEQQIGEGPYMAQLNGDAWPGLISEAKPPAHT